ncbi:MAG: hypothetical protein ACLFUO_03145 [Candidatus Woesearchaeota archaeon]
MIIKLFGLMDLATATVFLLVHFNILVPSASLPFLIYLGIKIVGFWGDINAYIEIACIIYMFLMLLGLRSVVVFAVAIYFLQKSVLSLMA